MEFDSIIQSYYADVMKTLTIREVPDDVYTYIVDEAKSHHRSIQEQVRYVLGKEARIRRGGLLVAAEGWRQKLEGRDLGDTRADLRAGRDRR